MWCLQIAVVRRKIRWVVFWIPNPPLRLRRGTVLFNCWTHIFLLFSLTAFAFIFHSLVCWSSHDGSRFCLLNIRLFGLINDFNGCIGRQVALVNWFLRPWLHIYLSQLGLSTAQLCLALYFHHFQTSSRPLVMNLHFRLDKRAGDIFNFVAVNLWLRWRWNIIGFFMIVHFKYIIIWVTSHIH